MSDTFTSDICLEMITVRHLGFGEYFASCSTWQPKVLYNFVSVPIQINSFPIITYQLHCWNEKQNDLKIKFKKKKKNISKIIASAQSAKKSIAILSQN